MGIFSIITHLSEVMALVKAMQKYVGTASKEKRIPTADEARDLFDAIEALLDSGVIDIPGVDEKQISEGLKKIEEAFCTPKA